MENVIFAVGALSTVPLAIEVLGRNPISERRQHGNPEAA